MVQVRFRALCVIEALQRHEGGSGVAAVTEHFRAQPGAVNENLDSPQASVREKAKKVGPVSRLGFGAWARLSGHDLGVIDYVRSCSMQPGKFSKGFSLSSF